MTIGSKILQTRKNKGFSQEELASQAGISLRTLQRIEKSASHPHGHTLKSLCAVLDLEVENLMDYGKFESRQDLVFLHLGVMAEFFIPLGSIILPLVLWLNKKHQIVMADEHGKNILNFQILRHCQQHLSLYRRLLQTDALRVFKLLFLDLRTDVFRVKNLRHSRRHGC